jgi:Bacterial protein of unknown function (DUF922)
MIFKCIVPLLVSSFLLGAFLKEDPIPWSGTRRLTWNDFKAAPDPKSTNAALTSSKISFKYSQSGSSFRYSIACEFDRNSSWGKVKTPFILAHEQGHFDISEIHARKLHKALKLYNVNEATLTKDVSAMYQKVMEDQNVMQSDYDSETNFSRNTEKQLAWLEKIKKELERLEEYAGYGK